MIFFYYIRDMKEEEEEELRLYKLVNQTENLSELAEVIRGIGNTIKGKSRPFNSTKMANICENFHVKIHNNLTRNFGIRQQAIMLFFYEKNKL